MTLMDEAISAENLLQLLEYLDRILEIYGATRKNERIATIALFHSLFPLGSIYDASHTRSLLDRMIVMRNVNIDTEIYNKIFKGPPLGRKKTELDLFFLNIPTVLGHPSEGKINFYVEIEMGEDVSSEMQHLPRLRRYFKDKELEIYPILIHKEYKGWDEEFNIPILNIEDLKKMVELIQIRSLADIPGVAYEWAATSLQILQYVTSNREVDFNKMINYKSGLWDSCPDIRQHNFNKLIEGKISSEDYEDFSEFRNRMMSISSKMVEKGLLNRDAKGRCELSIDGRDILGCYYSCKEK
jgi:hypothetical protein